MESNEVLQRYMNLPKFLYLLQESALFLPKMSIFDDHLEGGLTAQDYLETSNDAATLDIAMNGFTSVVGETTDQRSIRLAEANSIQERLRQRTFETPFGVYKCDDIEKIFPRCREWLYVSCWHKSPHECSAMWSLYGDDNNSVCIFTTEDKLKTQTHMSNEINNIHLESVEYIDHGVASLKKEPLTPFLAKSLPFCFEKEARLVAFDSTIDLSTQVKNGVSGVKISIQSLSELIDGVVISPKADDWFANSIKQLCTEYGLNVVKNSKLRRERVVDFFGAFEQLQENGL